MSQQPGVRPDPGFALLDLYDAALPQVYGYLLSRCREPVVAEDLTAETFLAAVDTLRRRPPPELSIAWLVGVARHKLADHWRQQFREERGLRLVGNTVAEVDDPWDCRLDVLRARQTLARLGSQYRAVLTLRYLDGLPVAEVAEHLDRTVRATETLLQRAKAAFRAVYTAGEGSDD